MQYLCSPVPLLLLLIVFAAICRDPSGTMLAFADMMKKQIVMPAHMMDDNIHLGRTGRNIFQDFSTVAESTGTYTAQVCAGHGYRFPDIYPPLHAQGHA